MITVISKDTCYDGLVRYQVRDANNPITDVSYGEPDEYYNAAGEENHSNLFEGMKRRRAQRQARKDLRTKSKAEARLIKAGAKQTGAEAQKEAAVAMGKTEGDVALAKALTAPKAKSSKAKGLSTGAKIGIGVGVALVVGVIAFVIIKKKNKK